MTPSASPRPRDLLAEIHGPSAADLQQQLASFKVKNGVLPENLLAEVRRNAAGIKVDGRELRTVQFCTLSDETVKAACTAMGIGFHERVVRLVHGENASYFTLTRGAFIAQGSVQKAA